MRPNTIKGEELYVRCPYCGDSNNQNHAHMTINMKSGLYHCLRCNVGGKVTSTLLFHLQLSDIPILPDANTTRPIPEIIRGPATERPSLLERWHTDEGEDVFYSWWRDQHVGYYLRDTHRKRLWGFSGINWAGAPRELLSDPEHPLRFVEGPYDVLHPDEVCFFGIPSYDKIKSFFSEHWFILVPDGDLWTDGWRHDILLNLVRRLINDNFGFLGVEFLPSNQDPDNQGERRFIPAQYFKEHLWKNTSLSSKARRELARAQSLTD